MLIFGVTGNIGSGKSAVCRVLGEMGGYIIDADKLGHEVIMNGRPAYDEIIAELGADFLFNDGEIDRKRLGELVFSDTKKLKKLIAITHKYITKETTERIGIITQSPGEYKFIAIDAPLLFEAGMEKMCDYTILTSAEESVRLGRVIDRDGLTYDEAIKRSQSRKDAEGYAADVSFIITNDGGIDNLRKQVERCVKPLI